MIKSKDDFLKQTDEMIAALTSQGAPQEYITEARRVRSEILTTWDEAQVTFKVPPPKDALDVGATDFLFTVMTFGYTSGYVAGIGAMKAAQAPKESPLSPYGVRRPIRV